ncbi:MAG: bifunctional folylpolyglutamate synthase/dihydrofolate synthase [Planctomycetaceae bacterium]|nr:bifunctional folylpolyglutamate synthase/dihydrofolate synthase [Planctomycetaceae bacterium]
MPSSPDNPIIREESAAAPDSPAHARVMDFINSRINFERLPAEQYELQDFKLDRMRELLSRLGDPQRTIPAIHIAGTKGKGSTAAMTAAILSATGTRIGLFTSPHLDSIGERMTVNGQQPTGDELLESMKIVRPVVEEMDTLGPAMSPTFFECITAIAWMHFRDKHVQLVVLEVGLGGRLDATNVCSPLATVITSISRDHERLLGNSLACIATEKAGIIKSKVPVISGVTQEEPREVIRHSAEENGCQLFELDRDIIWTPVDRLVADPKSPAGLTPLVIDVRTPWRTHRVKVPLPGEHQARNLALSLAVCDQLSLRHAVIPSNAITRSLAQLCWPLRIEVLRHSPLVIVDAAHNDGSVNCLIDTLRDAASGKRVLIFATSKDKDTHGLLAQLGDHFDRVILTQFVGNPRSVPIETLVRIAAEVLTIPYETATDPTAAWQLASQSLTPNDMICATGSFFLAAEMRALIKNLPFNGH